MKRYILTISALLLGLFAAFYTNETANAYDKDIFFSARSAIVIESSTNRVLYEKNAYQKLPMASTTKIMTALTVLNSCDVNDIVTVPKEACGIEGSSIYLQPGERLSVLHLLYGLMLRSGNDSAVALALHAGGSCENFAKMMNEQAHKIGAFNSNFVNPHGLHNDNHYTTAYDLAVISSAAMKNKIFSEIVSTKRIEIPCTARNYNRVLYNKNKMLTLYGGATGIKTGYTKKAGRCLVSSAKRDGMELICVVLDCGPMWEVSMRSMDYVYANYKLEKYLHPYTYWGNLEVKNRNQKIGCYTKESFSYPVCKNDRERISVRVEIPDTLKAPIKKDELIGKIKYYYDNQLIFSANIYTINGVESLSYLDALKRIIAVK